MFNYLVSVYNTNGSLFASGNIQHVDLKLKLYSATITEIITKREKDFKPPCDIEMLKDRIRKFYHPNQCEFILNVL